VPAIATASSDRSLTPDTAGDQNRRTVV
jgi:hypothetical protein